MVNCEGCRDGLDVNENGIHIHNKWGYCLFPCKNLNIEAEVSPRGYAYAIKQEGGVYKTYWHNNVELGELVPDYGCYFFYTKNNGGGWTGYSLVELGNLIEKLDKKYFNIEE